VARSHKMLQAFFTGHGDHLPCACNCRQALGHGIFADLKAQDDAAIRPIHALVERFL